MHVILSNGFAGSERYAAELASVQSAEHDVMLVVRRTHRSRFGTSVVDVELWTECVSPRSRRGCCTQRAVETAHSRFSSGRHSHAPAQVLAHRRARATPTHRRSRLCTTASMAPHFFQLDGLDTQCPLAGTPDSSHRIQGQVFKLDQLVHPLSPVGCGRNSRAARVSSASRPNTTSLVRPVGSHYSKGLDNLIEAFRLADLPDARLVILGEGRERRRLERLLGPNMAMPGFRENVKDYYQAFDLLVRPSRSRAPAARHAGGLRRGRAGCCLDRRWLSRARRRVWGRALSESATSRHSPRYCAGAPRLRGNGSFMTWRPISSQTSIEPSSASTRKLLANRRQRAAAKSPKN